MPGGPRRFGGSPLQIESVMGSEWSLWTPCCSSKLMILSPQYSTKAGILTNSKVTTNISNYIFFLWKNKAKKWRFYALGSMLKWNGLWRRGRNVTQTPQKPARIKGNSRLASTSSKSAIGSPPKTLWACNTYQIPWTKQRPPKKSLSESVQGRCSELAFNLSFIQ